jgi:uncharacterized alkaline shock family protein YloU
MNDILENNGAAAQQDGGKPENTAAAGACTQECAAECCAKTGASPDAPPDKLQIADEVISAIAVLAVGKVPAAQLSNAGVSDGIAGLLGMKNTTRGVRVETGENGVSADISVTVEYGSRINEVAKAIQDVVRADITEMTGLAVTQVNVHVLSVTFKDAAGQKAKAAKEPKETKEAKEAGAAAGGGTEPCAAPGTDGKAENAGGGAGTGERGQ